MARFKLPKSKCERILAPKSGFAPRSFRWIKTGKAFLLIGCPKGEWMPRAKRCKVGTRAHAEVKAARGRCARGSRRVSR